MEAQAAQDFGRVLNSLASANNERKQYEIFTKFIKDNDMKTQSALVGEIADKAIENMLHAKAFLLLLDYQSLFKALGQKDHNQLLHSMRGGELYTNTQKMMESTKRVKPKQIRVYKAKVGIILQLLFLLRERIAEEGLPPLKLKAPNLALTILDRLDDEPNMIINLDDFGKGYWNLLVDLLKEADFRSKDQTHYELVLTEGLVKMYSSGSHLAGSTKGSAGQHALSDAMVARIGRNIVKRLGLTLRTVKMYQTADHPSVGMSIDAMHGLVSEILDQRPSITLTRMGSDLLIDDVKNRKKEQFIEDFVQQLDERNINSITFTSGVSVEEVRVLASLFAMTFAQVKKQGGAKKILDDGGVSHILVDQFKYGLISGDEEEMDTGVSQDEKMLENIVFTELVGRLKQGKDLGDLKAEDVGAAFKQLVSGAFRKDKNARKTLSQMLMAIDPNLAEKAIFSKEGLRGDLQWSSARKMIDELMIELPRGSAEDRMASLENLSKMADMTIAKNKDTTLTAIIDKLLDRLRLRERDIEVMDKVVEVLANLCKHLIINGKYNMASELFRNIYQVKTRCEHLPEEKKDEVASTLPELIGRGLQNVSDADVVDVLVRDLESDSVETVDRIVRILELINTEMVVEKLLNGFLHDSRSVRNRCYQALISIGDRTLTVCTWKLKMINDPDQFTRGNDGRMTEGDYYIARNCIDLISKLGGAEQKQLLKDLADDEDPRIRKEVMLNLSKMDPDEGAFLAKLRLTDPDFEVVKAAIRTLGSLKVDGSQGELADIFFAQPDLRKTIIESLGNLGGDEAESLMIPATTAFFGGNLGRIYRTDNDLRAATIKALGQCTGPKGLAALRRMSRMLRNPLIRLLTLPMKSFRQAKSLQKIVADAVSRAQFRLK